jgi:hypothetical protein
MDEFAKIWMNFFSVGQFDGQKYCSDGQMENG